MTIYGLALQAFVDIFAKANIDDSIAINAKSLKNQSNIPNPTSKCIAESFKGLNIEIPQFAGKNAKHSYLNTITHVSIQFL